MPDRKLHARRSSVTAPDPFGEHLTTAQSHSTITILRVEGEAPLPSPDTMPSSPGRRSSHRRMPSNNSEPPPRLSFAFTSFGNKRESSSSPPPSPGGSRRHSAHSHVRLSPEQLFQLAKSTVSQRPSSPVLRRAGSPVLHRNNSRPSSPVIQVAGGGGSVTPATFTPLPDNIYLPFIERPSEVAALIASHPTCKLLSLLSKTLPPHTTDEIPDDPAEWSHENLIKYMTTLDRDTDPDAHWVACIKSCVRPHSELIWERLKGALGVPPDVDLPPHQQPAKMPMSESGYDSDVFIESPVIMPRDRLSPEVPAATTIIEPLLSPPGGGTLASLANPPPLSLPAAISPHAHELSGLQEEDEEEQEGEEGATQPEEPEYTPAQIQGLRIATMPSPVSPLPPYPYYPTPRIGHSHSFSNISPIPSSTAIEMPHKSPAQHDPLAGVPPASSMKKSASSTSLDSIISNMSSRSSGPLFPSNFARLTKSPRAAVA